MVLVLLLPAVHIWSSSSNVAMDRHAREIAKLEKAAAIYRRLAKNNSAALPDLAKVLINLSGLFYQAGRHAEGLPVAEEATAICRRLMIVDPDDYQLYLAGALTNLSNLLDELDRDAAGLAAIEEAIAIYRRLAEDNPNEYLPHLARASNNRSNL